MFLLRRRPAPLLAALVLAVVLVLPVGALSQGDDAQLIVRFTQTVGEPASPEFVEALSRDAGVQLLYLRPMSGGAHVFVVPGPVRAAQLEGAIQRLSERSDVVYAELDLILHSQGDR